MESGAAACSWRWNTRRPTAAACTAASPQTGALFGLALGNLTASVVNAIFTEEQFLAYGWRIPFLLSALLVAFGLWIRNAVEETPSFQKVRSGNTINQKSKPMPIFATVVGLGVIWPMYGAVLGTLFAERYSPDVRYTGISLGYQVGAALVGGPAPLIGTWLLRKYNRQLYPSRYLHHGLRCDLADCRVIRQGQARPDLDA